MGTPRCASCQISAFSGHEDLCEIQDIPKEEMALKFTIPNHSEWIFTIPSFPTSQLPTIFFATRKHSTLQGLDDGCSPELLD